MNLHKLFLFIIAMSFMGSIVAGIIFLIKSLLKDKLSAIWHYYIWFLLIIRLVIPYAPETSFSIFNLVPYSPLGIGEYMEPGDVIDNPSLQGVDRLGNAHSEESDIHQDLEGNMSGSDKLNWAKYLKAKSWLNSLQMIWVSGVLTVILYNVAICFVLLGRINHMARCRRGDMVTILDRCRKRVNAKKMPDIIYYPKTKAPSLFGYFKPKILISQDVMSSLSLEELEYVFLHEMVHIRRRDILINWMMVVIQALHWFNPIVWYAFGKMRNDCEIICDAQVLTCLEPEKHKNYGNTIIRLLEILSKPYWNPGTVGMATNKSEIKRRIIMIKKFNNIPFRWTVITVAVIILIGGIGLTNGLTNAKGLANSSPSTEDNKDAAIGQIGQVEEDPDKAIENNEPLEEEDSQGVTDTANSFPQHPKVSVEVAMVVVERDQKQVDEGHSPWQLSPFAVAQTFVGLQISPDGIKGEFPVDMEDMKISYETDEEVIVEISGDKTPVSRVYLKRLIRQDEDGIWTVIGYDPVEE